MTASIKRVKVTNFKSFKDLDVALGRFNILIGANSTGKSSFVQIFQFIKDIIDHGLDNAVSLQGGVEYLRNISLGKSMNLSLEFQIEILMNYEIGRTYSQEREKHFFRLTFTGATYRFSLGFPRTRRGFKIVEDELKLDGKYSEVLEDRELSTGRMEISFQKNRKNLTTSFRFEGDPTFREEKLESYFRSKVRPPQEFTRESLILQLGSTFPTFFLPYMSTSKDLPRERWRDAINLSLYDFDPKLSKRPVQIRGKVQLESDGANLAIVLKKVTENSSNEKVFSNLIRDLLPFVEKVKVKNLADRSILFNMSEKYHPKQYLPSPLISDGTISIAALILALYFDGKKLTLIEEPERNLHPHLLSRLVSMMKDASANKQLIITTHNPEIVRNTDIKDLLLVKRGNDGFSTIIKPAEVEEVRVFLRNDMDLGELYIKDLLGGSQQ